MSIWGGRFVAYLTECVIEGAPISPQSGGRAHSVKEEGPPARFGSGNGVGDTGAGDTAYWSDHRQHRRDDQCGAAVAEVGRRHARQGGGDRGSRSGDRSGVTPSSPAALVASSARSLRKPALRLRRIALPELPEKQSFLVAGAHCIEDKHDRPESS